MLQAGVDTFYMTKVDSAGHSDTLGREVQTLEQAALGSRSVWLQAYQYLGKKGEFTSDSLTMDLTTLLPIAETRYNADGREQVRYDGTSIRTALRLQSGSEIRDTTISAPVYSSSTTDAIARAFPSTIGDRVHMLLFSPFPAPFKIGAADVQNISSEVVPGRAGRPEECWVVRVDMGGGFTRFWVNKATHEVARIQSGEGSRAITFIR
ncbi:MAG TPA: hypothetical protein VLI40_12470 [Gemmatimonadaceae bacterium]|nr:hypothetical protein [Gemmatimonadaceae bacterium]